MRPRGELPPVPFIVTGTSQDGPVQSAHADAKAAVDVALALIDQGISNVQLKDPTGKVYAGMELHVLKTALARSRRES